jgi:hypothetical protein
MTQFLLTIDRLIDVSIRKYDQIPSCITNLGCRCCANASMQRLIYG